VSFSHYVKSLHSLLTLKDIVPGTCEAGARGHVGAEPAKQVAE